MSPRQRSRTRRAVMLTGLCATTLLLTSPAVVQADEGELSNTITDVPGVKVGHYDQLGDGYRTGTTVILTEDGATTGYSQQGGGPGTRETDLLTPGGLVTEAHAVVLSGGSAYGLDAAGGTMRWLEEQGIGYPVGQGVVPIVPSAILFDLGRGGDFSARPDAEFGYQAVANATSDPAPQGRVGAGVGASRGLGTASVELENGYRVGAIVALNPGGSPVNPDTCRPYGEFLEIGNEFNLTRPNARDCPAAYGNDEAYDEPFNTTIAVVATDAPLDQTQAQRMAMIANSGLSRSIKPVHNLFDGDTVFAMATGTPAGGLSNRDLGDLYNAGADALGRAVVHAILESETIGNNEAYCDQYPSACRKREHPGSGSPAHDADESAAAAPTGGSGPTSTALSAVTSPEMLFGGAVVALLGAAMAVRIVVQRRQLRLN